MLALGPAFISSPLPAPPGREISPNRSPVCSPERLLGCIGLKGARLGHTEGSGSNDKSYQLTQDLEVVHQVP